MTLGGAVFLDRDGVLNETAVIGGVPKPPKDLSELRLLEGVEEACERLRAERLRLIVVTNQPDVARGTQTLQMVQCLNNALLRRLKLDDVYTCTHDDCDACACRKPKPGMLLEAARKHGICLSRSVMVGDRDKDIEAGRAAGCRTVHISAGYGRRPEPAADLTVASLREAVSWIISQANGEIV